jgi:segregation and condensation protein B
LTSEAERPETGTAGEAAGAAAPEAPETGAPTSAAEIGARPPATESGAGTTGELFPAPAGAATLSDEEELAKAAQDDLQLLAEAARFASPARVQAVVEALLFVAEKPLDLDALQETTHFSREQLEAALEHLKARYAPGDSGVALTDLGGRWQLRTDAQVGAYVRRLLQVKPMRLTRAALETLAMVAYRQPVTRPELEELRGVDCGAVTKALLERKLVRILGKKDEPGRPLLYGTSKEFLELFNLRDLTQLPTLREFQELSEESRKIVEDEAPAAPAVAGLTELAHDPALEHKMAEAAHESDAALHQLERAMAVADEQSKSAAAVLAPPSPPPAPAPVPNASPDPAAPSGPNPDPQASKDGGKHAGGEGDR